MSFSLPVVKSGHTFRVPPTRPDTEFGVIIKVSCLQTSYHGIAEEELFMKVVINSKTVAVPDNIRDICLLDFIRDFAGLKGTKFGCGTGLCGACTIHVEGVATRSCQLLVSEVAGQQVTTIEGLANTSASGSLHPVQKAWIEEAVPQCGYCQAGQIMTAVALLDQNDDPSEAEIKDEMSGNICRCGTYDRIRKAIVRAAKERQIDGVR